MRKLEKSVLEVRSKSALLKGVGGVGGKEPNAENVPIKGGCIINKQMKGITY